MGASDLFAQNFDPTWDMSIQDWFLLGRDRVIPELLPMTEGRVVNLGQGKRPIGDATPLDREHHWNAEVEDIPLGTEMYTGIWAHAFFDYISQDRLLPLLRECHRILQHGGVMNIVGPHGLSDLWAEDALRKTRFTEMTWRNLFNSPWYEPQAEGTRITFDVHATFIMGVDWRNLSLFTQLVKR